MLKQHETFDADLTIATSPVKIETASEYGILSIDETLRIRDFEEKPKNPKSNLASMGIYVFKVSFLQKILQKFCGEKKSVDFGRDIIPEVIASHRVYAYQFEEYWRDVGTLEEYWNANIELTLDIPPFDLYKNSDHNIYTKNWELPPAKFGETATVARSLISGGCIIKGRIEDSVLSSNVIVEEGAFVKNSIIFDRTTIKRGCLIDRTIIDKDVVIGELSQIGFGNDLRENREVPKIVHTGLNLIGKYARIPAETVIERNCRVLSGVTETDFKERRITSGETVSPLR